MGQNNLAPAQCGLGSCKLCPHYCHFSLLPTIKCSWKVPDAGAVPHQLEAGPRLQLEVGKEGVRREAAVGWAHLKAAYLHHRCSLPSPGTGVGTGTSKAFQLYRPDVANPSPTQHCPCCPEWELLETQTSWEKWLPILLCLFMF